MASSAALRPGIAAEQFIRPRELWCGGIRTTIIWWRECSAVTEHNAFAEERVTRQVILRAEVDLVHTLLQGLYTSKLTCSVI